ncbi:hypothetical protein F2P56_002432 [Juglans regia]|uniref:Uncharacterized protein n=1 Tax=Juglans regia TaxID=51240 RepID=A0A834D9K6_JUGRE|nr:hypothetical protein F2P56_002432 [Juglans regia]
MCGDATNWDEDAYRESILKEREIRTRTVFRTVWAPSQNPNPDAIVVASSDGSLASYSISSCISKLQYGFNNTRSQHFLVAEPQSFLQGHDGPAYDIKFYGRGEDTLLLSCGDDGRIRGWRWKEFTNSDVPIPLQGTKHENYLHCIVARNTANQAITGSEDGTARIWDCKSGKCIQVIDPAENSKLKGFVSCVSCIALDGSESWLVRFYVIRM